VPRRSEGERLRFHRIRAQVKHRGFTRAHRTCVEASVRIGRARGERDGVDPRRRKGASRAGSRGFSHARPLPRAPLGTDGLGQPRAPLGAKSAFSVGEAKRGSSDSQEKPGRVARCRGLRPYGAPAGPARDRAAESDEIDRRAGCQPRGRDRQSRLRFGASRRGRRLAPRARLTAARRGGRSCHHSPPDVRGEMPSVSRLFRTVDAVGPRADSNHSYLYRVAECSAY
jgi:hypothetical protein